MPRCKHCGDEYERRTPNDRYCIRCDVKVREQIAADAKRWGRFARPKAMDGVRA